MQSPECAQRGSPSPSRGRGRGAKPQRPDGAGRERRSLLRRKSDRLVAAAFVLADELWRKCRARAVRGYLYVPLATDGRLERVLAAGRAKPYADVGALVDEAGGAVLDGRATRWSIVDDGHGAAAIVMGRSTEDLIGVVLTRSDRAGVTLHGRTMAEAAALDQGRSVPGARPRLSRDEVAAFRRELRRDSCFPATAFKERRTP